MIIHSAEQMVKTGAASRDKIAAMSGGLKASPVLVNPPARMLGEVNSVLVARARPHRVDNFPGPLSIKTVVEGAVTWTTGGRDIEVDENSLLVLNHGERYSMDIDSDTP